MALVAEQLEGERLRGLWDRLGELERAAVAEVVHGARHIVVPVSSERAFRRALRDLGYPVPAS